MKIIEQFIKGKENDPKTCEDGLFTGSFIAAVIDGVTPKSNYLWQGKTSGCYAKDLLLDFDFLPEQIHLPEESVYGIQYLGAAK